MLAIEIYQPMPLFVSYLNLGDHIMKLKISFVKYAVVNNRQVLNISGLQLLSKYCFSMLTWFAVQVLGPLLSIKQNGLVAMDFFSAIGICDEILSFASSAVKLFLAISLFNWVSSSLKKVVTVKLHMQEIVMT